MKKNFSQSPSLKPMLLDCDICGAETMGFLLENEGNHYYKCGRCGLEKQYPLPLVSDIESLYNEGYFQGWGDWKDSSVESIKINTALVQLGLVPKAKDKNILDCGCAAGYFLKVAEGAGFKAYGVELSRAAADIAKVNFPAGRVCQGVFEDSLFLKDFFYAIFMNGFLEHARDPQLALRKAYELLEPGGYILITTPDTSSFSYKLTRKYWPHYGSEHLFLFNNGNIKTLLQIAGFKLLSVDLSRICVTFDYLKSKITESGGRAANLAAQAADLLPGCIRFKKAWFSLGQITVLARKA